MAQQSFQEELNPLKEDTSKKRLRPLLIKLLNDETLKDFGFYWKDKEEMIWRLPWKTKKKSLPDDDDAKVLKEIAKTMWPDEPKLSRWKELLRNALRSLDDIKQIEQSDDPPDPTCKLYKFVEEKPRKLSKRSQRSCEPSNSMKTSHVKKCQDSDLSGNSNISEAVEYFHSQCSIQQDKIVDNISLVPLSMDSNNQPFLQGCGNLLQPHCNALIVEKLMQSDVVSHNMDTTSVSQNSSFYCQPSPPISNLRNCDAHSIGPSIGTGSPSSVMSSPSPNTNAVVPMLSGNSPLPYTFNQDFSKPKPPENNDVSGVNAFPSGLNAPENSFSYNAAYPQADFNLLPAANFEYVIPPAPPVVDNVTSFRSRSPIQQFPIQPREVNNLILNIYYHQNIAIGPEPIKEPNFVVYFDYFGKCPDNFKRIKMPTAEEMCKDDLNERQKQIIDDTLKNLKRGITFTISENNIYAERHCKSRVVSQLPNNIFGAKLERNKKTEIFNYGLFLSELEHYKCSDGKIKPPSDSVTLSLGGELEQISDKPRIVTACLTSLLANKHLNDAKQELFPNEVPEASKSDSYDNMRALLEGTGLCL